MKRLTKWFKKKLRQEPNIPQRVMKQIEAVEELNTIHRSQIHDKKEWSFKAVVDEYIHQNILWKTGIANGNETISPVDRNDIKKAEHILLQRVFWGENQDTCCYGTMSFIRFKKKWYYVNSKICQYVGKLPAFEDCYAQYTTENGEKECMKFDHMKELFFEYAEDEE